MGSKVGHIFSAGSIMRKNIPEDMYMAQFA